MERAMLSEARYEKCWSLEEVAERISVDPATIARWEKGDSMPRPANLRQLCKVFGKTARELGFTEGYSVVAQNTTELDETADDALTFFRKQDPTLRLMRVAWNWPTHNARYQELQMLILLELGDNSSMDPDELMSRRDALRRLA